MSVLTDFVQWISDLFNTVFSYISGFFDSMLQFFKYIGFAFSLLSGFISGLPPWLTVIASVVLFISVLYLIIGRDTGGAQ